ncbi:MAG: polyprenyl synthetase family protein [Nevskiales bacterium]|nr:polyprenyl synthetase family protein [Nevskiales bacterium]
MDLKALLAPIADDLRRVDAILCERLASDVALINEIGAHITAAGGKRLRPAVVLLSSRALGCRTDEPAQLAAIIELIHTATLLHDDVVDGTDRRRGRITAHALWGNASAVLCGDFLYSRSFQMMVDAGRMSVMRLLADTTNAIAEGEVLQLQNRGDATVTESRYLRVIELKTARLFAAAARLGAIAAEQPETAQQALACYGHELGMAFQIVDDLLDYRAAPEHSGKNIGTDLAEGKPTLPLIHALRHGSSAQSELIRTAILEKRMERLDAVLAVVESTGGIAYSAALAARHVEAAVAALNAVPDSPHKDALIGLARFTAQRTY